MALFVKPIVWLEKCLEIRVELAPLGRCSIVQWRGESVAQSRLRSTDCTPSIALIISTNLIDAASLSSRTV